MTRRLLVVGLALVFAASYAAAQVGTQSGADKRRSGYLDMGEALQKMQDDDTANPGMLFVQLGGQLWAKATGAADKGYELYEVDAIAATAQLVADLNTGSASADPASLTALSTKLYFVASNGAATGLWVYSGSGSPTRVTDSTQSNAALTNPTGLTVFASKLYFAATASADTELYSVDSAGTMTRFNLVAGASSSNPQDFVVSNDGLQLFFTAKDAEGTKVRFVHTGTGQPRTLIGSKPTVTVIVPGANNDFQVTAPNSEANYSGVRVVLINDRSTSTPTADFVAATKLLNIHIQAGVTTANQIVTVVSALSTTDGLWLATTTEGTGNGTVNVADTAVTSGSAASANVTLRPDGGKNDLTFTAIATGTSDNNTTIRFIDDGTVAGAGTPVVTYVGSIAIATFTFSGESLDFTSKQRGTAYNGTVIVIQDGASVSNGAAQATESGTTVTISIGGGNVTIGTVIAALNRLGVGGNLRSNFDFTTTQTSQKVTAASQTTAGGVNPVLTINLRNGTTTAAQVRTAVNASAANRFTVTFDSSLESPNDGSGVIHAVNSTLATGTTSDTVTLTGGVRSTLTLPLTNTDATKLLSFSVTIGSTNVSLINLKGLADSSAVAAALNNNSGFSSAGLSATWSGSVLTILDDGIAAFSNVSLLRADEVDSSVAYTTGDAVPSTAVFNVTTASVNADTR